MLPLWGGFIPLFATPIRPDTLANALELRDASGQGVAGQVSFITNLDGDKVIGARFQPNAPLGANTTFTAILKGGAGGVTAEDGRQMPEDYRWSFTVTNAATSPGGNPQLFLPLIVR